MKQCQIIFFSGAYVSTTDFIATASGPFPVANSPDKAFDGGITYGDKFPDSRFILDGINNNPWIQLDMLENRDVIGATVFHDARMSGNKRVALSEMPLNSQATIGFVIRNVK